MMFRSARHASARLLMASGLTLAGSAALAAPVAEGDMLKYCQGEAASKFDVSPREILTMPLQRSGSGYVVYGQYPQQGSNVTRFECHYSPSRTFQNLTQSGASGGSSGGGTGGAVAVADMPRYCQDRAASKFGQNPSNVTTKPAEKNDGRYKVVGHYARPGHNGDKFVCDFDKKGVFQGVKKKEDD